MLQRGIKAVQKVLSISTLPKTLLVMLFFLISGQTGVKAQYPVNVTTTLIPPYTVYLSDYASETKLSVIIAPLDPTLENYRCHLGVEIKSNNMLYRTITGFGKEVVLNGNEPIFLTGADLAPLFEPAHLQIEGADKADFYRTGRMSEGEYSFSFFLKDYYRDVTYNKEVIVSKAIPAIGYLILNEPPIINEPRNLDKIRMMEPQNVLIQWTPRHMGSPNSAFSTEYELFLYEVLDNSLSNGDVVSRSQTIYNETTQLTSVIYGPDKPTLIPGRSYVLRVQARNIEQLGTQPRYLFRNNGYSEAVRFTYGDPCLPPAKVTTKEVPSGLQVSWPQNSYHTAYQFKYKKEGDAGYTTADAEGASARVYDLVAGKKYYVQIKASCGTFDSEWSSDMDFTAPAKKEEKKYACTGKDGTAAPTNTTPLNDLKVGDRFTAAGYVAKVTKVTNDGNGSYTGECLVAVPYYAFARVPHTFKGIKINTDYQMFQGELVSIYNPNSSFLATIDNSNKDESGGDTGDNTTSDPFVEGKIDIRTIPPTPIEGTIEKVEKTEDGKIMVTTTGGQITTLDPTQPMLLADDSGNEYAVKTDGTITQVPSTSPPDITTPPITAAQASTQVSKPMVVFKANTSQVYGFDDYQYEALANDYDVEAIGGANVYLPWKSIVVGKTDKITVEFKNAEGKTIKITDANGTELQPVKDNSNNTQNITINGIDENDKDAIEAYYTEIDSKGKEQKVLAGKLNVVTYAELPAKLYIIPVNEANSTVIDAEVLDKLKAAYNPAGVKWEVNRGQVLTVADIKGRNFNDGENAFLSNYTEDMKLVIDQFKEANSGYDRDASFLFLINETPQSGGKLGQMPLGRQWGFIFTKGNSADNIKRTIAHELGHGPFKLPHTWSEYGIAQGTTNNLMDYNGGIALWKRQWDWVQDPGFSLNWFQDEEEGAYIDETKVEEVARFINYIKCAKSKGYSFVEIHHGWNGYNVNIGSLINYLDYNKSGTLVSTELGKAMLKVFISEGYGSEPDDIIFGYHDIKINLTQANYKEQNGLTIPAAKGSMIFYAPIETNTALKKQIFDWLLRETGLNGKNAFSLIQVNNNKNYKAKDIVLFSECELEQIIRSTRESLIKELIADQEDFINRDKDTYQYLLINLLRTIPGTDKSYFYKLFEKNPTWLSYLYENMASAQQDKLMKVLIDLWYNNYSGNVNLAKAEAKNAFIVTNSIFGNAKNYLGFSQQGEVIFTVPQTQITEYTAFETNEEVFRTSPFKPIFLGIEGDNSDKPFTVLPAICIKYYTDKGNMANMKEALMLTANVALFAVGVGEVVSGVRGAILIARTTGVASTKFLGSCLRISLGVADLAASITSNYCNGANSNSGFCQTWKEYEFYINMGLLTASVSDMLYTKLSNTYTQEVKSQLSKSNPEAVKFIEEDLGILAKGVDEVENFLIQQPKIQESLNILKSKNLTSKFGGASEVQASSIHRYTVSSFELNGKLNKGLTLTEYETKWLQSIKAGLASMRNSKKYIGNVFRGQTLDEALVLQKYVNPYYQAKSLGGPAFVEEKALLSCTKDNSIADYFVQLSKNKIKNGEAGVSVKFNIKSKRGVDIDDISDYGKNLCSGNPKCQKIQQEILLENGTFKINDVQKTTDNGVTHYEIYLEEF